MKKTSNWTEEHSFCFLIIFLGVNSNRGLLPGLVGLFFFFARGEEDSGTTLKLGKDV